MKRAIPRTGYGLTLAVTLSLLSPDPARLSAQPAAFQVPHTWEYSAPRIAPEAKICQFPRRIGMLTPVSGPATTD